MVKLLNIESLTIEFSRDGDRGTALNNLSLRVDQTESLGVVGESGSGKTLLGLSILNLAPRQAIIKSGKIFFNGKDILSSSEKELQSIRGKEISMIFQEPLSALNPVFKIGDQIGEVVEIHEKNRSNDYVYSKVVQILKSVQIPDPEKVYHSYPHQLSGGLRQRVMIAIALVLSPSLIIADEPTTALDVTIQAEILDLIKDIQNRFQSTFIIISHDIAVVGSICKNIAVMYAGRVVELASSSNITLSPKHPYSQALLNSVPSRRNLNQYLTEIKGEPPDIFNLPEGCSFHPRCKDMIPICKKEKPPTILLDDAMVECWLYQ
ncbi:MAG: ABC transporter ATP-binding protein [Nitrospinota bacterium]